MEQKFDAIVVGAGPAGCACGYRLAQAGLQVLVVERGKFAGAKCIVAINRDPEAHIFQVSDFGVVGDYRQALPPLIEKCKALVK